MEFLTSTILSGIIYDLVKEGIKLSVNNVFSLCDARRMNYEMCEEFIENINSVPDENQKELRVSELLSYENKYTVLFEQQMYPTNFAKRLDYILTLMNNCGYGQPQINVEKLGDYLGFKSSNDLKQYYKKDLEPEYAFIENLADRLGVNAEWLKYGQGEPFASSLKRLYSPTDILCDSIFDDVNEFIFVMEDEIYRRELGVIVRFDNYKYSYYPRTYVFHADVGATGTSELVGVYKFLRELNALNKMPSGLHKIPLETNIEFFSGKVYPGMIKKYKQEDCRFLLDDFIRLNYCDSEQQAYKNRYGQVFVDCQRKIKENLI